MNDYSADASYDRESQLEEFDKSWHSGNVPDIEDYLRPKVEDDPSRLRLLIELIMIDQEYRWRRAASGTREFTGSADSKAELNLPDRPRLEHYVTRFPELGALEQFPERILSNEYRILRRWGGTFEKSDGSSPQHPDDFDQIASETHDAGKTLVIQIRCPHCHASIELIPGGRRRVSCPSCSGQFNLLGKEEEIKHAVKRRLGRFKLLEHVGTGSFGNVWKARDEKLKREVAIKFPARVLTADESEQFLREAQAAAQLRHPNIVSAHEVGRDGDTVFIVSDYVHGVTLADWIRDRNLTSRETAQLCTSLAGALHHAHEAGVIHRDVKPANIMLDSDGEPHIMDFGLARHEADEVTMTMDGKVLGTPAYMSPEQAQGLLQQTDRRADIYSLGVILFELLTGEKPFRGNLRMVLHQVIHVEAPPIRRLNPRISKDLETICLRCLEKEPAKRYPSARHVAEELQRFLRGEPIKARPLQPWNRTWRWCKRRPIVATLAASLLVSLLAGFSMSTYFAVKYRLSHGREIVARQSAEREARFANVRRLAIQSRELRERYPQRSLLLAMEAINISRRSKERHLPEAQQAVREALDSVTGMGLDVGWQTSGGRGLWFGPSGRWLVTGRGQILDFNYPNKAPTDALASRVVNATFSHDGRWLVMLDENGGIHCWDSNKSRSSNSVRFVGRQPGMIGMANISITGYKNMFVTKNNLLVTLSVNEGKEQIHAWNLSDDAPRPRQVRITVPIEETFRLAIDHFGNLSSNSQCDWFSVGAWSGTALWRNVDLPNGPAIFLEDIYKPRTISPDNRWLVTTNRSAIEMRSLNSPDPLTSKPMVLGEDDDVGAFKFSPDSRWLLGVKSDHPESVWQSDTARLWDVSLSDPTAHVIVESWADTEISGFAFSPDSRWLAIVDGDGFMRLRDLTGKLQPTRFKAHSSCYLGSDTVAFSPNSRWLATAGTDRLVCLWDLKRDTPPGSGKIFRGHENSVDSLAFSSNNRWLCSASRDSVARIWDLEADSPLTSDISYASFQGSVKVAYNKNNKWIVSQESKRQIRLHNMPNDNGVEDKGMIMLTAKEQLHVKAVSPDGRWLLTSDGAGSTRLWDLTLPDPSVEHTVLGHDRAIKLAEFSQDGTVLVTVSDDAVVRVWKLSRNGQVGVSKKIQHGTEILYAAISPDNQWLLIITEGSDARLWNLQGERQAYDVRDIELPAERDEYRISLDEKGRPITVRIEPPTRLSDELRDAYELFDDFYGSDHQIVFSADKRWLVIASINDPPTGPPEEVLGQQIISWDLDNKKLAFQVSGQVANSLNLKSVSVSSDSRWLASIDEQLVRLRRLDAGQLNSEQTIELAGHDQLITCVGFSPDNRFLATACYAGRVRLWDMTVDGRKKSILLRRHDSAVECLAFSPDGRYLATGTDSEIRLWDLTSVAGLSVLGLSDSVLLSRNNGRVDLTFTPDSDWLIAENRILQPEIDRNVHLYDLRISRLMQRAQRAVGRDLSDEERQQYRVVSPKK